MFTDQANHPDQADRLPPRRQLGLSLVVVMMILTVISVLGIGGMQIARMIERGVRHDRDMQIARQAAEAGLMDAEFDIDGLPANANAADKRNDIFERGNVDLTQFIAACGNTNKNTGLCKLNPRESKAAWLAVDFTDTGSTARTVPFGKYTGQVFPSGATGLQPVRPPRYVIEPIPDHGYEVVDPNDPQALVRVTYVYRVTSMGFGPREDVQAVLQMIYR